ncbi:MAG: hypothetical protein KBC17_03275 [Candidatus Pacebacteria bacterium]|nr:hypothetical protein [Candidatus Paceibacterota bacterium]
MSLKRNKEPYPTPLGNFMFAQSLEQHYLDNPAIQFPDEPVQKTHVKKSNVGTVLFIVFLVLAAGATLAYFLHNGQIKF